MNFIDPYDFSVVYSRSAINHWFTQVTVYGTEKIPRTGPVLFLANHPSLFVDPLMVVTNAHHIRPKIKILAAVNVWRQPISRWLASAMGCIPVFRREDAAQSKSELESNKALPGAPKYSHEPGKPDLVAFRAVVDVLVNDGNASVLIHPEGHTHHDREPRLFKAGTARILNAALENGSKPITVIPTYMNHAAFSTFRTSASISYGPPVVFTKDNIEKDPKLLAEQLRLLVSAARKPAPAVIPVRPRLWAEAALFAVLTWYFASGYENPGIKTGLLMNSLAWLLSLAIGAGVAKLTVPAVFTTTTLLAYYPIVILFTLIMVLTQGPVWTCLVYLPLTFCFLRVLRIGGQGLRILTA